MRRLIFVAVVALSGCKTTAQVMSLPGTGMHANALTRDEYVVLGDAEGKACVEESCYFGFCFTKSDTGSETKVEGRLNTTNVQTDAPDFVIPGFGGAAGTEGNASAAEEAALYKAIESVPDADALMAPRKSAEVTTSNAPLFGIIYNTQKACVRVFGKGIRLKTDAEVAAMTAPAPTTEPPPAPMPPPPSPPPAVAPTNGATP
jgi:hypothetical protein